MRSISRRAALVSGAGALAACAGCMGDDSDDSDEGPENETDGGDGGTDSGPDGVDSSAAGGWRSFRSGPANDGVVEAAVPESEPSALWDLEVSTAVRTTAAITDGTTYAAAGSSLYVIEAGEVTEEADLGASVTGSPAVADDAIVCPVGDALAIADREGANVRRVELSGGGAAARFQSVQAAPSGRSSPTVADGVAYVAGPSGDLVAVDVEAETVAWRSAPGDGMTALSQAQTTGSVRSSPAVADGLVVVGTESGVVAFDAADESVEWSQGTDWPVTAAPALVDGTVYVGGPTPVALDAAGGDVRWRATDAFETAGRTTAPPIGLLQRRTSVSPSVAVADDLVVVHDEDRRLVALDRADGSERWTTPLEGAGGSAPTLGVGAGASASRAAAGAIQRAPSWSSPAIGDETVVVGTSGGLVAASLADGTERWRYATGNRIVASPAVGADAVVVGDDGGTLYGLGVE